MNRNSAVSKTANMKKGTIKSDRLPSLARSRPLAESRIVRQLTCNQGRKKQIKANAAKLKVTRRAPFIAVLHQLRGQEGDGFCLEVLIWVFAANQDRAPPSSRGLILCLLNRGRYEPNGQATPSSPGAIGIAAMNEFAVVERHLARSEHKVDGARDIDQSIWYFLVHTQEVSLFRRFSMVQNLTEV